VSQQISHTFSIKKSLREILKRDDRSNDNIVVKPCSRVGAKHAGVLCATFCLWNGRIALLFRAGNAFAENVVDHNKAVYKLTGTAAGSGKSLQ
jgi:hypothetical protein